MIVPAMVGVEELASLDFVLWHRTGQLAARAMGCNQSTVSRRLARCLAVFELPMTRCQGEWVLPFSPLLRLERELHQLCRLLGHHPLRVEACPLAGPRLLRPLPEGWIGGAYDHVGVDRPLHLLRERVIDAWLCDATDDLPAGSMGDELVLQPLWRSPVQLHAAKGHPLVGERGLSLDDLRRFPSLDIPATGFLRSRALFHEKGLGLSPVNLLRYDPASWEGRSADRATLVCFTPLNRLASPGLAPLDAPVPFSNGGGLICHRELADHPAIQELLGTLQLRLARLAPMLQELERL
jgi:DNA-binding transcriptional LysR family regulator